MHKFTESVFMSEQLPTVAKIMSVGAIAAVALGGCRTAEQDIDISDVSVSASQIEELCPGYNESSYAGAAIEITDEAIVKAAEMLGEESWDDLSNNTKQSLITGLVVESLPCEELSAPDTDGRVDNRSGGVAQNPIQTPRPFEKNEELVEQNVHNTDEVLDTNPVDGPAPEPTQEPLPTPAPSPTSKRMQEDINKIYSDYFGNSESPRVYDCEDLARMFPELSERLGVTLPESQPTPESSPYPSKKPSPGPTIVKPPIYDPETTPPESHISSVFQYDCPAYSEIPHDERGPIRATTGQ